MCWVGLLGGKSCQNVCSILICTVELVILGPSLSASFQLADAKATLSLDLISHMCSQ